MTIYYSADSGGFYDDALHRTIPGDAVSITPARHLELLEAQDAGVEIVASEAGTPVFSRSRVRTDAEKRVALAALARREARARIDAVAPVWRQLNDLRAPGPQADQRFAEIDAIRARYRLVEADIAGASGANLDRFDVRGSVRWDEAIV